MEQLSEFTASILRSQPNLRHVPLLLCGDGFRARDDVHAEPVAAVEYIDASTD